MPSLGGLASIAGTVSPRPALPIHYGSICPRRKMIFIEDMRSQLLGPKPALDNVRNSVGAILDAIAYNLDDGICGPSVDPIIRSAGQPSQAKPGRPLRASARRYYCAALVSHARSSVPSSKPRSEGRAAMAKSTVVKFKPRSSGKPEIEIGKKIRLRRVEPPRLPTPQGTKSLALAAGVRTPGLPSCW